VSAAEAPTPPSVVAAAVAAAAAPATLPWLVRTHLDEVLVATVVLPYIVPVACFVVEIVGDLSLFRHRLRLTGGQALAVFGLGLLSVLVGVAAAAIVKLLAAAAALSVATWRALRMGGGVWSPPPPRSDGAPVEQPVGATTLLLGAASLAQGVVGWRVAWGMARSEPLPGAPTASGVVVAVTAAAAAAGLAVGGGTVLYWGVAAATAAARWRRATVEAGASPPAAAMAAAMAAARAAASAPPERAEATLGAVAARAATGVAVLTQATREWAAIVRHVRRGEEPTAMDILCAFSAVWWTVRTVWAVGVLVRVVVLVWWRVRGTGGGSEGAGGGGDAAAATTPTVATAPAVVAGT